MSYVAYKLKDPPGGMPPQFLALEAKVQTSVEDARNDLCSCGNDIFVVTGT